MSQSRSTKKMPTTHPAVTASPGREAGSGPLNPTKASSQPQPQAQTIQKPVKSKPKNSRRRSGYKSGPSLWWMLPFGLVALAVVALFLVLLGGNQISGKLVADKTSYDFGQVKLNGGLVTTQIPLKVQDDGVLVSKITTT